MKMQTSRLLVDSNTGQKQGTFNADKIIVHSDMKVRVGGLQTTLPVKVLCG